MKTIKTDLYGDKYRPDGPYPGYPGGGGGGSRYPDNRYPDYRPGYG